MKFPERILVADAQDHLREFYYCHQVEGWLEALLKRKAKVDEKKKQPDKWLREVVRFYNELEDWLL